MKRMLSLALAAIMFCAMTVSVSAAPQLPDRICPGEVENNGVLGGMWLESDTFVPVSTGVGDLIVPENEQNGMTAVIEHVDPLFTKTAMNIATVKGGTVIGAVEVNIPALIPTAKVILHIKDGYDMPDNISAACLHGTKFHGLAVEKINDRQVAITVDRGDTHVYIFEGASIPAGAEEDYASCLGWN